MPEGYTSTANKLKRFNDLSSKLAIWHRRPFARDTELTSPPYVDNVLRGIRTFQKERIISPALDDPSAAVSSSNATGEAARLFLGELSPLLRFGHRSGAPAPYGLSWK